MSTDSKSPLWSLDTRLQRSLAPQEPGGEPLAPPIFQTSTYTTADLDLAAELAGAHHPSRYYTRYGSPNVAEVEAQLAALEGADAAIAVGSGMAAISAMLLSQLSSGDHVVAQNAHYTATLSLLTEWLPRQGVRVSQVDHTDPGAFAAAIQPETRLIHIETPTNPTMALTDIAAVAEIAKGAGATLTIDNTFASSFNQQPHALGADLVAHSATKFLNGHSDVTAGVVTGDAERMKAVWEYSRVMGPVLHPMEAWLLLRGLRTYALRMRRVNESAQAAAEALAADPRVAATHYPGLPSHPQHALAARQMTGGFGGMVAFELAGAGAEERYARALQTLKRVRLCAPAVSLGGMETLICHAASMIFANQTPAELEAAKISPGLIRLSVGLEDPGDIIGDLLQALP